MIRPSRVLYVCLVLPLAVLVTFLIADPAFRHLETALDVHLIRALGVERIPWMSGSVALLVPQNHPAFHIVVTASCSSLSAVLALVALGLVLPTGPLPRRLAVALGAAAVIFVGNVVRIDSCILVGLAVGRASLVLFHNWVGSIFSFCYVLGGFLIMLAMSQLPAPHLELPQTPVLGRGTPRGLITKSGQGSAPRAHPNIGRITSP